LTLQGQLLQTLITGLSVGSIYTMVGLAFMVIYAVTRILNFAIGDYVMLASMMIASLYAVGLPLIVAALISLIITSIIGLLSWRIVTYPMARAPGMTLVLLTLGVSMVLRGSGRIIWGADPKALPDFVDMAPIHIGQATMYAQIPWILGLLVLSIIGLYFLFDRTLLGKALRATSEQPMGARSLGISGTFMSGLAFLMAAGAAALTGIVMVPYTMTSYDIGIWLLVKGFIASLVGGIDKVQGVVLGGLSLGLLEAVTTSFISSNYKDVIPLSIFLVLLLFRPNGLLGGHSS
jgi:branched-chain amino acid transport system permease protein